MQVFIAFCCIIIDKALTAWPIVEEPKENELIDELTTLYSDLFEFSFIQNYSLVPMQSVCTCAHVSCH